MKTQLELKMAVLANFKAIQECLNDLQASVLEDSPLPAWVDPNPTINGFFSPSSDPRICALSIIRQLAYLPLQAPREILVCAGFIGSSPQTLMIVKKLNSIKDDFKNSIIALKHEKINLNNDFFIDQFKELLNKREYQTTIALRKVGLSKLHLKQCYRKLPILNDFPYKIRWTWANTRAIKRISHEEAENRLLKKGQDEGIFLQIKKLHSLKTHQQLAIVQELAPHLRANIVIGQAEDKKRFMVKGPVPIFFPATLHQGWPDFKAPEYKKSRDKNRIIRADVKLDPVPFLPAIHAHCYKENPLPTTLIDTNLAREQPREEYDDTPVEANSCLL